MLRPGERLGPYVVVQRLGQGGMGQTYLCILPGIEQRVCVKVIRPELAVQPEARALFQREAHVAASLRHPLIAGVVAVDDELGYVAYEYVEGCDLRRLLSDGEWLVPTLSVYILSEVCRALEYAHNRRQRGVLSPVVHRDVSPSNIMVDRWGNVKLIDFGVARALAEEPSSTHHVRGKLVYMAPEQALAADVDGRTDQYALGVIAYELFTGHRPHDGADEKTTFGNIVRGSRVPVDERVPDLPSGLGAVVERMLATEPGDRFPSMSEVYDALGQYLPRFGAYRALATRVRSAIAPVSIGLRESGDYFSMRVGDPVVDDSAPYAAVTTGEVISATGGSQGRGPGATAATTYPTLSRGIEAERATLAVAGPKRNEEEPGSQAGSGGAAPMRVPAEARRSFQRWAATWGTALFVGLVLIGVAVFATDAEPRPVQEALTPAGVQPEQPMDGAPVKAVRPVSPDVNGPAQGARGESPESDVALVPAARATGQEAPVAGGGALPRPGPKPAATDASVPGSAAKARRLVAKDWSPRKAPTPGQPKAEPAAARGEDVGDRDGSGSPSTSAADPAKPAVTRPGQEALSVERLLGND